MTTSLLYRVAPLLMLLCAIGNTFVFRRTYPGWGVESLEGFLVKSQSLPAVLEKLQKAFPAAMAKHETVEEIGGHLERIRPGFLKAADSLAGPTALPRIMPSACPELTKGNEPSQLVV